VFWDLYASWSDDETPKAISYELRPGLTRNQHGLVDLLATKDITGLLEAVHQEPMHITSEVDNVMFDRRFRTDAVLYHCCWKAIRMEASFRSKYSGMWWS
jgi:hypothetical protein